MLRRWFTTIIREAMGGAAPVTFARESATLGAPVLEVYRVDNGFLLHTHGQNVRMGTYMPAFDGPTFIYCKDLTDLTNQITASAARTRIGAPKQYDLFDQTKLSTKGEDA